MKQGTNTLFIAKMPNNNTDFLIVSEVENINPKFLNFIIRFGKCGITNCTILATIKF